MDPALQELIEGDVDDVIEAVVKLNDPARTPSGFKTVSQFGAVATGRLARRDIRRIWADPSVHSLKAARLLQVEDANFAADEALHSPRAADIRRPHGIQETGAGCVVGIIDWGIDHDCAAFKTRDGASRILSLWDQRGTQGAGVARRYGYGRAFSQADINTALRERRPYDALGYHPGESAPNGAAHGTHVTDIAAGNGFHGGPVGMAPDAELVFVHLSAGALGGLANLGDSVRILEAIDYIDKVAGARPCAINMSVGRHAGPHTGKTLLEQGIDALLAARPNRAIIMSSGNYHMARVHASGRLAPGQSQTLTWQISDADRTTNELEIWYPNKDVFSLGLSPPGSRESIVARIGENKAITIGRTEVGRFYHRANDPNTPDHHIDIFLYPSAPTGEWRVMLKGEKVLDGRFHAWIERDSARRGQQSHFSKPDADPSHTIGSICNGFLSIAVGAANMRGGKLGIANFSSEGPTRDGRQKPDIVAPGVSIIAAASPPLGETRSSNALARKSGASQAAPHAAGAAALVFQAARRPLSINEMRRALIGTAHKSDFSKKDERRFGAGLLDVKAAIRSVKPPHARGVQFAGRRPHRNRNEGVVMSHETLNEARMDDGPLLCDAEEVKDSSFIDAALGEAAGHMPSAGVQSTAADLFDSIACGAGDPRGFTDLFDVVTLPDEILTEAIYPDDIVILRGLADGNRADMRRAQGHPLLAPNSAGATTFGTLAPGARVPPNILVLRQRSRNVGIRVPETLLNTCLPGEGPPAALPDPERRGLHPLVYRGTSRRRSRNPTVGDAQELLNNFLGLLDPLFASCTFTTPGAAQRVRQYLNLLRAAGQNPLVVDCRFGPSTDRATRIFQLCKGLTEDGKIGPITWAALETFRTRTPVTPPPVIPPIIPPTPITPPATRLNPPRWRPILRRAFRTSPALHTNNAVKFLIDGRDTFREMVAAIRSAQNREHYIYLLGWVLVDNFQMVRGDPDSTVRRLFQEASRRGVQIRVMLWDQVGTVNSAEVRRINALPNGGAILDDDTGTRIAAHHQKVLVVRGAEGLVSFCGGIDINDDRVRAVSGGLLSGGIGSPLHDVHCRIEGPSAHDLLQTFINRWNHHPKHTRIDRNKGALLGASEPRPAPLARTSSSNSSVPPRTCSVAIARTFQPRHRVIGIRRECDIRSLLLASIAAAQRFIYMEDQYLISQEAAAALNRAARRLQHITILISSSETSSELICPWELRLRFINTLLRGLSNAARAKIRIFHRIDPGARPTRQTGPHTKIHAKTWVFDDEMAVIGSANCNRRGWQSDSEVNAFVFDDAASIARTPITPSRPSFAQKMRMRLWSEHLTIPQSRLVDGVASARHWLSLPASAQVEVYNPTASSGNVVTCGTNFALNRVRNTVDPAASCP